MSLSARRCSWNQLVLKDSAGVRGQVLPTAIQWKLEEGVISQWFESNAAPDTDSSSFPSLSFASQMVHRFNWSLCESDQPAWSRHRWVFCVEVFPHSSRPTLLNYPQMADAGWCLSWLWLGVTRGSVGLLTEQSKQNLKFDARFPYLICYFINIVGPFNHHLVPCSIRCEQAGSGSSNGEVGDPAIYETCSFRLIPMK